jgi:xanthosine utilization system XapX-like protein
LADNETTPPEQIGPSFVGVAVGAGFTVTDVVYTTAEEQPVNVLLSVTEYVAEVTGETDGFSSDEVNPAGPAQLHWFALVLFALIVVCSPAQMMPSVVAPVDTGIGFTVTTVVKTVVELQPVTVLLRVNE